MIDFHSPLTDRQVLRPLSDWRIGLCREKSFDGLEPVANTRKQLKIIKNVSNESPKEIYLVHNGVRLKLLGLLLQ